MSMAYSVHEISFGIGEWFAWKPGRETRAAWHSDSASSFMTVGTENDSVPKLPMMLRRRISDFGQKVVGAALMMATAADARYIFASRHGEFATTLRILEDLYQRASPSPADFSMSVHHALAGLLSIQAGNKAGHTTISAGRDTFGYGILEAVTTILEGPDRSALLVSYDEPLPATYAVFQEADEGNLPLIVVFDIVPAEQAKHRFTLSLMAATDSVTVADSMRDIPMGQRFIDFFLSDSKQLCLAGDTQTWVFHRVT